jgi:hypothetical protein
LKNNLKNQFEITDLGILHYFMGLWIWHMSDGIFLLQPKYATDLLAWFCMSDCKPSPTLFQFSVKLIVDCTTPLVDATLYHQRVGSFIYLTHNSHDLSFFVSTVLRFMHKPHEIRWWVAKRILIYLQGTMNYGVFYSIRDIVSLLGYIYYDWACDSSDRWSTIGYIFQTCLGPILWSIKKLKTLSLSSCEAEYRETKFGYDIFL